MDLLIHLLVVVTIYSLLALALDLIAGWAGLMSVAQAAFFGIGAYSTAILAKSFGVSSLVAALVGVGIAAVSSLAVSLPSLNLREDYFVLASFAVQTVFTSLATNLLSITRGPLGIPNVPPVNLLGRQVDRPLEYLTLSGAVMIIVLLAMRRLSCSGLGRVLRLIREDEILARALGKDVSRVRISTLALSAGLSAVAGSLYAHYFSYVDPSSFTVNESIFILSAVVIGGPDSRTGPILGAALLVAIPEALRFLGMPPSVAANLRQVLYGSLLIGVLLLRPQGLMGRVKVGRNG